jgi:hypothetical protein
MFEVIEIGAPERKRFFRKERVPVKMKATTAMFASCLAGRFRDTGSISLKRIELISLRAMLSPSIFPALT